MPFTGLVVKSCICLGKAMKETVWGLSGPPADHPLSTYPGVWGYALLLQMEEEMKNKGHLTLHSAVSFTPLRFIFSSPF